ncbi:ABC transporter permease [Gleimia hominis]|uniref:ABC transporter permease n=1 Tax=Gleimia hominis TaxID=595468 RepID=UPI000C80A303|nr:ABC transporter permease [Gleimia hominis]WIK63893.1 ABC transporter permease [Gleimia hominis]
MKQGSGLWRYLAVQNLRQAGLRTGVLTTVVAILTFVFYAGSLMSLNLYSGLTNLQNRMGADLMIVPKDARDQAEQVMLEGGPQTFYFDTDVLEQIKSVAGVEEATAQTFIASLNLGCCAAKVQIIGFDPQTDFVIQPWIKTAYSGNLKDGELIVGSNVHPSSDGKIRLFRHRFPVAAQLAGTGTSYDNTVFVNRNTIRDMRKRAAGIGRRTLPESQIDNAVSAVMVNVGDRYKSQKVKDRIRELPGMEDTVTISPATLTNKVKAGMDIVTLYVTGFVALFWVAGLAVLFAVFTSAAQSRKKELASLRIMGATRRLLARMLMQEAVVIGVIGGAIGSGLGALVMFPFASFIRQTVQLPYLESGFTTGVWLAVACIAGAALVSVLACVTSSGRMLSKETYLTLREGQ